MKNQVYHLPETIEVTRALEDSYVKPFLESVKSSYNSPKARESLGVGNKKVSSVNEEFAGSSTFINLFLLHQDLQNIGLYPNKTKPRTRPGLEKDIAQDDKFLKKFYADFGVAIWPEPETYGQNKLLYETLTKQFKDREISLGKGKSIYFSGLAKPREHNESEYGLVLDLRDLSGKELQDNGSIIDLEEFNWYFSKGYGMARAYLSSARNWDCDRSNLANSSSDGRVVGVGVEAPKNLRFGWSEEQIRVACEKAEIPGNYELIRKHLPER